MNRWIVNRYMAETGEDKVGVKNRGSERQALVGVLTEMTRGELGKKERVIERGKQTFIEVGLALMVSLGGSARI